MIPQAARAPLAVICFATLGCAGSAHPRQHARSRQVCERLLEHSYELEYSLATLALSDHGYQRRKIEASLAQRKQSTLASPTFLSSCNELTDREFACMSNAQDWFTYEACYQSSPQQALRRATPEPAENSPSTAAVQEPCPKLTDAGTGTATISGVIRDKKSNAPLVGVVVTLQRPGEDDNYVGISDEEGRYSIEGVTPAYYHVKAILDWRERQKSCAPLRGGAAAVLDFVMEDEPPPPSQIIEIK